MTKKHFKKLASAIATIEDHMERDRMAVLIGRVCQEVNDLFDWSRWHAACRGEKYKG
jgi:hypothetical protein